MNWSTFIVSWLEWPLKVVVTGILLGALLLLLNNIILLFRGVAVTKNSQFGYHLRHDFNARSAWLTQLGIDSKFHHFFKWHAWFWFKKP